MTTVKDLKDTLSKLNDDDKLIFKVDIVPPDTVQVTLRLKSSTSDADIATSSIRSPRHILTKANASQLW